jgi:hypothetical protein
MVCELGLVHGFKFKLVTQRLWLRDKYGSIYGVLFTFMCKLKLVTFRTHCVRTFCLSDVVLLALGMLCADGSKWAT